VLVTAIIPNTNASAISALPNVFFIISPSVFEEEICNPCAANFLSEALQLFLKMPHFLEKRGTHFVQVMFEIRYAHVRQTFQSVLIVFR